jgi:hypothetical protein
MRWTAGAVHIITLSELSNIISQHLFFDFFLGGQGSFTTWYL